MEDNRTSREKNDKYADKKPGGYRPKQKDSGYRPKGERQPRENGENKPKREYKPREKFVSSREKGEFTSRDRSDSRQERADKRKPQVAYKPNQTKEKMYRVERKKPDFKSVKSVVKTGPSKPRIMEKTEEFEKQTFGVGTMLYPIPAVMVSMGTAEESNIITVAWTGTICSDPAMLYISVRKERYSYELLEKYKSFVINLTSEEILNETDFCGVKSGKEVDKFKETKLEIGLSEKLGIPMVLRSPVNIECTIVSSQDLGSHTMFIANVENVMVSKSLMDEKGRFNLQDAGLVAYSHGKYHGLGDVLGTFGYSIRKKKKVYSSKKFSKGK